MAFLRVFFVIPHKFREQTGTNGPNRREYGRTGNVQKGEKSLESFYKRPAGSMVYLLCYTSAVRRRLSGDGVMEGG